MVLCGTSSLRAISPAARPSGLCFTSSRNTSRRVGWARAEKACIATFVFICPELSTRCMTVKCRVLRFADRVLYDFLPNGLSAKIGGGHVLTYARLCRSASKISTRRSRVCSLSRPLTVTDPSYRFQWSQLTSVGSRKPEAAQSATAEQAHGVKWRWGLSCLCNIWSYYGPAFGAIVETCVEACESPLLSCLFLEPR